MPFRRELYPPDWDDISLRIRERAGDRCECEGECGLHHGRRCTERHLQPAQYARGRVVLTCAHLDHDPVNCDPGNLQSMCNRCHLRIDTADHVRKARATVFRRRAYAPLPGMEVEA